MPAQHSPTPATPRAPAWLASLWRRTSITLPSSTSDGMATVLWGQTHTLFVDLRIPFDRPEARGRRSFDDFSTDELRRLAAQKGFAGHVELDGDLCSWIRYIDYRPSNGRPDRAVLRIDGDTLHETGEATSVIGSSYAEVYKREGSADGKMIALRGEAADGNDRQTAPDRVLVVIGERFLYARERAEPLPSAESLADLLSDLGDDRERICACLDCEISYGRTDGSEGWTIASSTLPFREGERLFSRMTTWRKQDAQTLRMREEHEVIDWAVVESTLETHDLSVFLSR